ncbi:MAG: tetratricopeptide repeat protein [Chthoniobacterales bacterium]
MKQPLGTTFIIAASLLGVAALAQLVAILVYFGPGFKQAYATTAVAPPVVPEATPAPAAQVSDAEKAAEQARMNELVAEADKLEAGASPGDALVPLEEALAVQPRNAELIARVATLHERLDQTELAQATWQKVVALGADAGKLFDIAEVRLKLLQAPAADEGMELRDQTGLQPGSALGVVDLKVKDGGTQSTPVKDLRLAVKARPGEPIDARDVRINVTFYETLDGEIVPTMSRVQSMWFTTPVDWKGEGVEILEVKYEVPRLGADGGPPPQFYGYMVNIYHRGQLQETRAEPADLQDLFPPPLNEVPAAGDEGGRGSR